MAGISSIDVKEKTKVQMSCLCALSKPCYGYKVDLTTDSLSSRSLQLGGRVLAGHLHDAAELGGLHDVALDLELAAHEHVLGVGLAVDELLEVGVVELEGDFDALVNDCCS